MDYPMAKASYFAVH